MCDAPSFPSHPTATVMAATCTSSIGFCQGISPPELKQSSVSCPNVSEHYTSTATVFRELFSINIILFS